LQTTALVHEAYLRLVGQQVVAWEGHAHFFGIASRVMREILVEHARKRAALKRGGARKVYLEDVAEPAAPNKGVDLLALDEALQRLERLDTNKAESWNCVFSAASRSKRQRQCWEYRPEQ
jgi:RNA polymerase sigma factor (TIGR02999 family)